MTNKKALIVLFFTFLILIATIAITLANKEEIKQASEKVFQKYFEDKISSISQTQSNQESLQQFTGLSPIDKLKHISKINNKNNNEEDNNE